nr:S8 family serine peptidase [Bacteroidota bacterium]
MRQNFQKGILLYAVLWCLFFFHTTAHSQTYINKVWEQSDGQPQSLPWTANALDGNGNLIVVGNTEVSAGNHDVLVIKYDREGVELWQETYGGNANGNDYGVAVFVGQDGDVIVAAVVVDSVGEQNIAVLKYTSNGVLDWDVKWNGPSELADVPADLAVADGDHLYVCGATMADATSADYFLIKYDWNGNYKWEATYDHAGLNDAATNVELNNLYQPSVTGGSASSINTWDYATLQYDGDTGEPLDTIRVVLPGVGLDQALATFMDEDGNTYVTGYRESGGQKDIQTIKINNDLTLAWTANYDGGSDDVGNAIAVDTIGNVYVAGYMDDGSGGTYFLTVKYNAAGDELWYERYQPNGTEHLGVATKLLVHDAGVVVAGHASDGESLNYVLVNYSSTGQQLWAKEHDSGFGDDKALALQADGEGIFYVSGISETATGHQYTTVKYDVYVKDNPFLFDSLANPLFKENEIIVMFRPQLLDTMAVDKIDWQHGTLDELLPDSVSTAMMAKLGLNNDMIERTKVFKFYRNYTRADSISLSRLGEPVRMPKLWATFIMQLDNLDLIATCDSLAELVQYIGSAHPNYALIPYSNDPIFEEGLQPNLTSTSSYPDAHINVEPAWDVQVGQSHIKVGIIDNGIWWEHPDFMHNGVTKVANGMNFIGLPDSDPSIIDTSLPFGPENNSIGGWHGTACAGIIGAIRNNEEGIAGIAGGDAAEGNTGCTLVPLVVYEGVNDPITYDAATAAITEGAADFTTGNGLACHALNISWGFRYNWQYPYPDTFLEAVRVAYLNKCILVGAHGNYYPPGQG